MRNVVSLYTYLKSYNLSRDAFDKEIEKDRDFFDKYIEWGKKKDGSDTILSPKALDRLGESFNQPAAPKMTITINGEVQESVSLDPGKEDKPKRKRRTKAEIEAERRNEQMDMGDFMDKPVESKKMPAKSKETPKKRKKSKLNITKQFIQEHGQANVDSPEILKQLRKFLMNDGSHKIEEVALMTDEEVQSSFGKSFYVIEAEEGTYFFPKSLLLSNMSEIFVVGKE